MLEPSYRQALSHAWKLVWHHKLLWIFGLFSVLAGQFGLNNFLGQFFVLAEGSGGGSSWRIAGRWLLEATQTGEGLLLFLWLCVILVSLIALTVGAAVASQGTLIALAASWFKKQTFPNVRKAWRLGVKHFWRLLAISVVEKILLALLIAALAFLLNIYAVSETTLTSVAMVVLLSVILFTALVISAVGIYSAGYVVVEERGLFDALRRGWHLFSRHILVSLELSLILVLCNFLLILILFAGSYIILIPTTLLTLIAGFSGYLTLLKVAVVLNTVLFVLLIGITGAIFNAFTTSAWIYLFMKMHHESLASRVVHWLGRAVRRGEV
ncbi:MAG TPA: hypothetical protein VJA27_02865 [Patescibacteria group bacterium]|nr:hypothetical protein [Patescibacteria group bacterium]